MIHSWLWGEFWRRPACHQPQGGWPCVAADYCRRWPLRTLSQRADTFVGPSTEQPSSPVSLDNSAMKMRSVPENS
jgi:hypothetical protein